MVRSESELEYGYIDDNGRFIRTDEAGNVIPSEPGKFDEAGNFKPEGSDGYYDTEGIKHPDLEKDTGGKYDEKETSTQKVRMGILTVKEHGTLAQVKVVEKLDITIQKEISFLMMVLAIMIRKGYSIRPQERTLKNR